MFVKLGGSWSNVQILQSPITLDGNNIGLLRISDAEKVCTTLNKLEAYTTKFKEQQTIIYHQAQRLLELTEELKEARDIVHLYIEER